MKDNKNKNGAHVPGVLALGKTTDISELEQRTAERKKAEEAQSEAEQKYRDIFENAGEGIFQTTPEGRYIAANPALARMHGFDSPEELISSLRDISRQVYVDPARREEFKSLLEEHGVVRGFEHQLFRKDGSKIWVSVNARAVHDARAAILYYEGTTQDINERKRAEARSGAFVALARKLSGALTPLDAGRIIAQTAGDLLGWDSCDLNLYDADRDLVHPMLNIDTIDGRQTEVTGVISERKPTARSRRVIDHGPELLLREEPVQFDDDAIPFGDKSRPSASIATVPIQHATRVIGLLSIQSYTTHCYDTAALDDLQALADHCGEALNRIRAEEALREREARLSAIYSAAPVGIGVDVNRVIQEVNDTMCSITGYSREEFIGQNSRFLFLTQKDYESVGREKYRGIAEHLPKSIMARLKRKDGRIIEVLLSAVPLDAADLSQGVTFTVLDITERKRAEESLQKSESLLRATGKMARVGGWEFDVATLKQVWTEAVYEIHEVGLDYEPNVSKGVDFYAPEAKPIIAQAVQRAIDYGEPFDLELPFITAQGNRRWIHAIGQAQQSAGKTTKVFGTFQDITEHKRAEEALRESEERYRDLVENSRELICTHDLDGLILSANRAAVEVLGYDPKDYCGKRSIRDILAPEVRHQFDEYMARLCKDGATSGIMLVQTISGERRVWEYYNSLRTEGVATPIVRGMARDITEQRRAEKAMSDLRHELELTMNSMEEGVHRVDLKGNIVFENPAAARMLGWGVAELLGKPAHLTVHHTRPDGTPYPKEECPIYATSCDGVSRQVADEVFWRRDGTSFPVEYMTAPMRNDRNEIVATVVTFRDITERRRAEAALRESEQEQRLFNLATNDMFWKWDFATDRVARSIGFERAFGYSEHEITPLIGWWEERLHPDDQERVLTAFQTALKRGDKTCSYEYHFRRHDGSYATISDRAYIVRDESGKAVRAMGAMTDITERKRAEDALRESESFRRTIVESEPECVKLVAPDYTLLDMNPAGLSMIGAVSKEQVVGCSVLSLIAPEWHDTFKQMHERVCQGESVVAELELIGLTGVRRWIETHAAPLRDRESNVIAQLAITRDITERKGAEESLKLFRSLIDQSSDAIEVIDPITFRFIDCNERAYRSLGYSREEFLSLTLFDIDPGVDRLMIARLDGQLKESSFATFESLHLRKDGTTFPVEINVKLVRLERDYRLAVVRDITDRKRAEEALRQSEERYRELFENAKDAIYVHDLSGRYTSVNRAAEQLTGFSREQILGKHYSNFVSPRDLKQVRTSLCRKLDEENETIYEVNVVNRDGRRIPVEISSRLIYESGVAVGVQGTARDITDRKRAQEALQIYSQRLIQAQEAERQKIARELHDEIGQVLTAVRINLQSIQRSCRTADCVPLLDESIGIVDEALGCVRELSIELRPSLLDDLGLTSALRWYVDRYARRTGIIAEVLNGFEDGRLPRELETACFRIAQEALTNVARHAQAGSVSVQLERSRERMLLTIIDDGVGFDIDKLRKSASAAAALGLRGMEERALALGGHLEIDSGLERGTRIRATFPLKRR